MEIQIKPKPNKKKTKESKKKKQQLTFGFQVNLDQESNHPNQNYQLNHLVNLQSEEQIIIPHPTTTQQQQLSSIISTINQHSNHQHHHQDLTIINTITQITPNNQQLINNQLNQKTTNNSQMKQEIPNIPSQQSQVIKSIQNNNQIINQHLQQLNPPQNNHLQYYLQPTQKCLNEITQIVSNDIVNQSNIINQLYTQNTKIQPIEHQQQEIGILEIKNVPKKTKKTTKKPNKPKQQKNIKIDYTVDTHIDQQFINKEQQPIKLQTASQIQQQTNASNQIQVKPNKEQLTYQIINNHQKNNQLKQQITIVQQLDNNPIGNITHPKQFSQNQPQFVKENVNLVSNNNDIIIQQQLFIQNNFKPTKSISKKTQINPQKVKKDKKDKNNKIMMEIGRIQEIQQFQQIKNDTPILQQKILQKSLVKQKIDNSQIFYDIKEVKDEQQKKIQQNQQLSQIIEGYLHQTTEDVGKILLNNNNYNQKIQEDKVENKTAIKSQVKEAIQSEQTKNRNEQSQIVIENIMEMKNAKIKNKSNTKKKNKIKNQKEVKINFQMEFQQDIKGPSNQVQNNIISEKNTQFDKKLEAGIENTNKNDIVLIQDINKKNQQKFVNQQIFKNIQNDEIKRKVAVQQTQQLLLAKQRVQLQRIQNNIAEQTNYQSKKQPSKNNNYKIKGQDLEILKLQTQLQSNKIQNDIVEEHTITTNFQFKNSSKKQKQKKNNKKAITKLKHEGKGKKIQLALQIHQQELIKNELQNRQEKQLEVNEQYKQNLKINQIQEIKKNNNIQIQSYLGQASQNVADIIMKTQNMSKINCQLQKQSNQQQVLEVETNIHNSPMVDKKQQQKSNRNIQDSENIEQDIIITGTLDFKNKSANKRKASLKKQTKSKQQKIISSLLFDNKKQIQLLDEVSNQQTLKQVNKDNFLDKKQKINPLANTQPKQQDKKQRAHYQQNNYKQHMANTNQSKTNKSIKSFIEMVNCTNCFYIDIIKQRVQMLEEDVRGHCLRSKQNAIIKQSQIPNVQYKQIIEENIRLKKSIELEGQLIQKNLNINKSKQLENNKQSTFNQ